MSWDRVIMVDWSGGNDTGAKPRKDAIWACSAQNGETQEPVYLRNRHEAEAWLREQIAKARVDGLSLMIGFDFPFGYPAGFAKAVTGRADVFALWDDLTRRITDTPKENNRFDVAAELNTLFPGVGPFWGNGLQRDIDALPRKGLARDAHGMPERRIAETRATGAFTLWQLSGAGAVGSQALMGIPVLNRLRRDLNARVWPFEDLQTDLAFVEIWPSLLVRDVPEGWIKDAWQVHEVARMISALPQAILSEVLAVDAPEEGWILGLGHEDRIKAAGNAPRLTNDCFAMPQGVAWTPVDKALAQLKSALKPVVGTETIALDTALGRVLAQDVQAQRSHPPTPNAAVDGYGFAGGRDANLHVLPLVDWAAAAGALIDQSLPEGSAVRILTGAALPKGVDTVVLQEDVAVEGGSVAFRGPVKQGANTRRAAEDMAAGEVILKAGRRFLPQDLGVAAATGVSDVAVQQPLRVGVLSTGTELVAPGTPALDGQIYDANRPMLLAALRTWGFEAVDLGHAPDDRAAIRARLDTPSVDAILTSGGASSGDADLISALLKETGSLAVWRIAVKPGRPLALGVWNGRPVFGLPGNPVAAMVCACVFARPALGLLAGEGWTEPKGFTCPARFSKRKKAGRREYLRARLVDGGVEAFGSEGSGRISGLSWADGLVELPHEALVVQEGDPVRFIPWSGFGT